MKRNYKKEIVRKAMTDGESSLARFRSELSRMTHGSGFILDQLSGDKNVRRFGVPADKYNAVTQKIKNAIYELERLVEKYNLPKKQ